MKPETTNNMRIAAHAAFHIRSDKLSVEDIARELKLQPDAVHIDTQYSPINTELKQPLALFMLIEEEHGKTDRDVMALKRLLDKCLLRLLDRIEVFWPQIESIRDKVSLSLGIAYGSDWPVSQVVLSPELLTRVARLKVPMTVSTIPISKDRQL